MNSENLIKIFRAFIKGDSDTFHRIAWDAIEEEKRKKHHLLANQLEQLLTENSVSSNLNGTRQLPPIPRDNEKGFRLLDIKKLYLDWSDVILSRETEDALTRREMLWHAEIPQTCRVIYVVIKMNIRIHQDIEIYRNLVKRDRFLPPMRTITAPFIKRRKHKTKKHVWFHTVPMDQHRVFAFNL